MISGRKLADSGESVGKYIWGFRLNRYDYMNTITKTFTPTKMMVRSNNDNTSSKKINYCRNHAVCVSKTGKILKSKVYPLYGDNVNYYDTEEECIKAFKKKAIDVSRSVKSDMLDNKVMYENKLIGLKKYEHYDE